MTAALLTVLAVSAAAALLLASVVRAALPGHLLHGLLAPRWQWWLIHRPGWLPAKPSGDCAFCTAFWLPGLPLAVAVAVGTPASWWGLLVAPFTAFLFESWIARFLR